MRQGARGCAWQPPDRVARSRQRPRAAQGYNAQAVVTPCQIILAADATGEANDVNQLTLMLDQAQVNVEAVTVNRHWKGVLTRF